MRMITAAKLTAAGFEQIDFEPTRVHRAEDARVFLAGQGIDVETIAPQVDGKFMSAFIRAVKPAPKSSMLWSNLLQLRFRSDDATQIQRSFFVYRKFGAIHYGRGHHESERSAEFRCL